jgi:hypothetical protein
MLQALAAAAAAAALVLLLFSWPWRAPHTTRSAVGWVLGVWAGFYAGCWLLGLWPHWPPREDQDRLLALVLPAALAVELVAATSIVPHGLAWALRLIVAIGVARVLLHGSIYLADLAGPGTRQWTPGQAALVLGGLAAALMAVWAALVTLAWRAPGRSVPVALAVAGAGAGLTIMLSGYASGGQLGLPLAAALAGATIASLVVAGSPLAAGAVAFGVVGLFNMLVIGRFFGELTTAHAALLFAAPLLCWLPELPHVRRLRPAHRGLARVLLIAIPVTVTVVQAQQKFVEESRPADTSPEPSLQDYMDFKP